MKLLSWNTAHRIGQMSNQVKAIAARCPDVVALQEVTSKSAHALRTAFQQMGIANVADSFSNLDPALLRGPRRYGILVASR